MIALPDHILLDKELSLHAIAPEHAPALFAHIHRHRAALSPYLDWVRHTESEAETAAFIARARAQAERGEAKVWTILWQGEAVSTLSFNEIDWRGRGTAAGYWLSPALHRRGIVSRALDALLHAVADDLPHCELRCAVHNAASNALAQHCGFQRIELHGTETINGGTYAQNIYRRTTVSARTRALYNTHTIND
nr:GNAT family N-acetyltransferase [Conchiformibius kuhniae]